MNRKIIGIQVISLIIIALTISFFLNFWLNYVEFTHALAVYFGKPEFESVIKERFFKQAHFNSLIWGLPLFIVTFLGVVYFQRDFLIKKGNLLINHGRSIFHILVKEIKTSVFLKWGFPALNLFFITELFYLPLYVDEASTINSFISKSFFVTLTYYPAPNNHVLFTLLGNIASVLPFSEWVAIRMVALILTISTLLFIVYAERDSKQKRDFLIVLLISSYPFLHYAVLGRGYSFYLLISMFQWYLIRKSSKKLDSQKWKHLGIVSFIGLAVMPSYVYALLFYGFIFLILNRDKWIYKLLFLLKSYSLAVILAIIFYTPIMLFSGKDALLNNRYVQAVSRTEILAQLPDYMTQFSDYFFIWPVWIFAIIGLVWIRESISVRKGLILLVTILFIPTVMLLHSRIPFFRTWIFILPLLIYGISFIVSHLNVKTRVQWKILIVLFLLNLVVFPKKYFSEHEDDFHSEQIYNYIQKNSIQQIQSNYHYVNPILRYQFKNLKVSFLDQIDLSKWNSKENGIIILNTNFEYPDSLSNQIRSQLLDSLEFRNDFKVYYLKPI